MDVTAGARCRAQQLVRGGEGLRSGKRVDGRQRPKSISAGPQLTHAQQTRCWRSWKDFVRNYKLRRGGTWITSCQQPVCGLNAGASSTCAEAGNRERTPRPTSSVSISHA